ncbi:MAG: hypothetical protein WAO30_06350, partial [Thermacetogeniaceae bacterium]
LMGRGIMENKSSLLGFIFFLLIGIFIGVFKPFQPELGAQGHYVLMLLLITIGLWIFKPGGLPFSVSGAFFMASLLAIGMPADRVFSGFAGTAVWSLIPALFFGFVLAKNNRCNSSD